MTHPQSFAESGRAGLQRREFAVQSAHELHFQQGSTTRDGKNSTNKRRDVVLPAKQREQVQFNWGR